MAVFYGFGLETMLTMTKLLPNPSIKRDALKRAPYLKR